MSVVYWVLREGKARGEGRYNAIGRWVDKLAPDVLRYDRAFRHTAPPGTRWVKVTRKASRDGHRCDRCGSQDDLVVCGRCFVDLDQDGTRRSLTARQYDSGFHAGRAAALDQAEKLCRNAADNWGDFREPALSCADAIAWLKGAV